MHIDMFIFYRVFDCKYFFIKLHVFLKICVHIEYETWEKYFSDANTEKIRERSDTLKTFLIKKLPVKEVKNVENYIQRKANIRKK